MLKIAKTSATLTFIIGQTILPMVKQKKTCVHFFYLPKNVIKKSRDNTMYILFKLKVV